jgi:hypothetical protein
MARRTKGKGERIDREGGVCEYIYMNRKRGERKAVRGGKRQAEGKFEERGEEGWRILS